MLGALIVFGGRLLAIPNYGADDSLSWRSRHHKSQVEDRVLQCIKGFRDVDASKVTVDAHFTKTLGLDSLDQVEVVMAFEDEFSIETPEKDAEKVMA